MNRSRTAKIVIFEPYATQENVDALNKQYGKNININARFVDPSNLKGGFVPPKDYERIPGESNGSHATRVGISAIRGYQDALGKDAKDMVLEIVIARIEVYGRRNHLFSRSIGERYHEMVERMQDFISPPSEKTPFTKEQRDRDPGIQQIKAVMDAESKLGDVLLANFSYGARGTFNTIKNKEGVSINTLDKATANADMDHLNVLFTENRGPWGPALVSVGKDNLRIADNRLGRDSPGILEDAKSTAARLANDSSVIHIDNEAVRPRDVGTLSHLQLNYFKDKNFRGNSHTAPYIAANMLFTFMKAAQETFPLKTNPKAIKIGLLQAVNQTAIRASKKGVIDVEGVSSIFKDISRTNLKSAKEAKLANVARALELSLEVEDRANPRNKDVDDPLSILGGMGPPVEGANFDTSNL